MTMRLLILPDYNGADTAGDGGIRRIVEAQKKYLPMYGIHPVSEPPYDCIALHAGDWPRMEPGLVPMVAHCHGLYWGEYEWAAGALSVNNRVVHNLLRADAVSVCSEFVSRAVRKALWIDPTIIYHGVDPDEWVDVPEAAFEDKAKYLLWNKARVDAICDPTSVYELAKRLPPSIPIVTTFLPANVEVGENVVVTGKTSYQQSQSMTKNADVYLGTTRGTFDISVIEAMLCGVPVLGWNWGSLPEAVMHKVHGYLAEPGDYDDLVAGYHYIQKHREAMSKAAREQVLSRFTWKSIMAQYAAMYIRVVTDRTSSPLESVV
jgi:glycosyltransferase involved in cell wall biosynthesis